MFFELPLLFAASPLAQAVPAVVGSALIGSAAFVLLRTIIVTLHTDDMEQDDDWRYDVNRINELRKADVLYRYFQPLIQFFAQFNRGAFRESLPEIHREIQASGLPRYWTAAEYLGKLELIGLLMTPAYIYVCIQVMELPGIVLALVMSVMTIYMLRRRLAGRARYRLLLIKRRLPFLLDLLTLLMEAGATFLQALKEAVDEFSEHPVGHEFGRVLGEMSMGKSRTTALESMRNRLSDDEITSIVGTIIQGENLGTPLARLFRTQADVLRIKRTQRAETLAGEAGVKMLLPGVLIMASTVIIILGPFILGFLYAEFM